MTNGLCKERMTAFFNKGNIAYQAFNQLGRAKIMGYVNIDRQYINCSEYTVDKELTQEEFEKLARHIEENR